MFHKYILISHSTRIKRHLILLIIIPTIFIFIAYWVIGLPGGYLLGIVFDFGVQGVWTSFLLALTASAIMLLFRFHIKSKHEVSI